ncbi:DUF1996 domain-containing protein [Streptomyces sporangiiformans]|uniref:DUF1996 domain-containing protein n=1 Tax=Streptomyces sporangiiformans TaxID=2315329 RepID=A0A505DHK6_9ACTN|nr:DUF1996 domain-containing protein [Streptomyces sporangiiformans]TPQ16521.1 DUF1996 domain-containing protein [Streptomyces sporangiiformans]
MIGGGGLAAVNVYATASESGSDQPSSQNPADQALASGAATIDCPDVGSQLTAVPEGARAEVDKELALLDKQIAEAYQRLQNTAQAQQQDSGFADNAIMNPLKDKRTATIERIAIAIGRVGDRPQGLDSLAACTLRASGNQAGDGGNGGQEDGGQDDGADNQDGQGQDQNEGGGQDQGDQQGGNGGQAGNGPVAADFADITTVKPNVQNPPQKGDASRGTFSTSCGVNANGLFNSDNVIVAPGVTNGAHHFHDYIGNQANDAFASDEDLANGATTCEDQGDKSSYFWPVLRLQNGAEEKDAKSPGGGIEGNAGEIVTPKQVTMTFVGNPRGEVTAMPRLLRIITGDAKAFVNGTANANASWSCTGFEDRQLKDKYPICPKGSDVVRTFKFQSCWDGRNIDSANHRTHVAFAAADGTCAGDFRAIPQLVQRIVYDVDAPSLKDGGRTTPLFAVDAFPEQLHKPVTDHGDFINVFDEDLMREMVDCINGGRKCDSGADADDGSDSGSGSGAGEEPQDKPTATPDAPSGGNGDADSGNTGGKGTDETNDETSDEGNDKDKGTSEPSAEPAGDDASTGGGGAEPKSDATPSAAQSDPATSPAGGSDSGSGDDPEQSSAVGGGDQSAGAQTEPQATTGGLADTGTQLWPAGAGAVLVLAGFVLLRRIRRSSM